MSPNHPFWICIIFQLHRLKSLQGKAASNYLSPSSVKRIDCLTLLVGKSLSTLVLLLAMSNETSGANAGCHTSPSPAKDVPFVRNKLIFPLSNRSLFHSVSYLLQGCIEVSERRKRFPVVHTRTYQQDHCPVCSRSHGPVVSRQLWQKLLMSQSSEKLLGGLV